MKKVTVKTLSGKVIVSKETADPKTFVASGILDGEWGNPNELTIEIDDISKDVESKEERMRAKRLSLVRDYSSLIPKRKERLRAAIDKYILTHCSVDVEDV
jgi:hypothetical protein